MKKAKTSAVLLLSVLTLGTLAGCGANNDNSNTNSETSSDVVTTDTATVPVTPEELTVDFKVLNSENAWTVLKTENVVDGKVNVPDAPAKLYYDFGGWYNEESFTTQFVATGIKESTSAYGKYVAQEVTVHINDEEPVVKNLEDVANATYDPGEGLIFNGWYKDAALKVKWNHIDAVTDLYAASMAMITFNNGYEDVYTTMVKPGTKFEDPAKQTAIVDGVESTLEKKEIVEYYMDEEDIHYVGEDGKAFDFTKEITRNQTITVNFNTVGLKEQVKFKKDKNQWVLQPQSANAWETSPVLSMQSTFTVNVANEAGEEVPTEVKVAAIDVQGDGVITPDMTKIIIGEGIKSIGGLNVDGPCKVTEVSLPTTLKIIDNCFNNFNNLTGIKLNEGVEVIIASFFKNALLGDGYKWFDYGENHDFEIEVPASVKNMAMVPTNFKFAEGSKFAIEDNRVILNEGEEKILVSDPSRIDNGTIVVPEGITKIQAGTYLHAFDYLMLPSTFKNVNYNARIEDYPYYSREGANPKAFHLFDETTLGKDTDMDASAFAISPKFGGYKWVHPAAPISFFQGFGIVKFNADKVPETMHPWAFTGDSTGYGWLNGNSQPSSDEGLKKFFVVNDDVANLYISLRLDVPEDMQSWHDNYHSYNAIVETFKVNTIDELIELVIGDPNNSAKAEEITKLLEGKTLGIYSDGKEITPDQITGEMFLTIRAK